MPPPLPTPLQTQPQFFTFIPTSPLSIPTTSLHSFSTQSLNFPRKPFSSPLTLFSLNPFYTPIQTQTQHDDEEEPDHVVGDCVVFEEGVFEDPYLQDDFIIQKPTTTTNNKSKAIVQEVNLVPDKWKEAQMEVNITKKEKRKIAQQIEYGSRLKKKDTKLPPVKTEEYLTYKEHMMSRLKPVVLANPDFPLVEDAGEDSDELRHDERVDNDKGGEVWHGAEKDNDGGGGIGHSPRSSRVTPRNPRVAVYQAGEDNGEGAGLAPLPSSSRVTPGNPRVPVYQAGEDNGEGDGLGPLPRSSRVAPRNPRVAVYKGTLDDITEFFNSGDYAPGEDNGKKPKGRRKLLQREEIVLLNKRIPNLEKAASGKWLPLHTLAASGDFYLVDELLKHAVDINAVDEDGLTALHKAILCRKHAVVNYLLRESANPFIRDKEGATLMHYAVQALSIPTIKLLLLYNVDLNLADDDGWTPLHLAVQTRRTDVTTLLLLKGADKTLRNQDGLTPLDLCLYSGRVTETCDLIKILKQLPRSRWVQREQTT